MDYSSLFFIQFCKMKEDARIASVHIAVLAAIYALESREPNRKKYFKSEIMEMAKISNRNTFYKAINALRDYGYLSYIPSDNQFVSTEISICDQL